MAACFRFYIILVEPVLELLFLDVKVNIPDFYLILWKSLGISILKIHRSLIWYEVSILLRKKHLIVCVFNVYLSSSKKFLVDCTKSTYVWWFKLIEFYVFEKTNCILYFLLWYFTDRYQQDETFNVFLLLKESSFHLTAKEEVGRVVG